MNYSIKEMSEMTGLAPSALRYYDKQGLLPSLRRDENNVRIFSDDDLSGLKVISCLKRSGLSIKDIKEFIDAVEQGDETLDKRLAIFTKRRELLRHEIEELKEISDMIEYKCWYYETACAAGTEDVMKNISSSDVPEKFRKARERLLGQTSS